MENKKYNGNKSLKTRINLNYETTWICFMSVPLLHQAPPPYTLSLQDTCCKYVLETRAVDTCWRHML